MVIIITIEARQLVFSMHQLDSQVWTWILTFRLYTKLRGGTDQ